MTNLAHLKSYIMQNLLTEKFVKKAKLHYGKIEFLPTPEGTKLYELATACFVLLAQIQRK